ncbi:MAG: hypothetical protein KAU99_02740 [Thermoplasmata archaeon]|nr:hypothetical protein [Thermoplasmata archaeon]
MMNSKHFTKVLVIGVVVLCILGFLGLMQHLSQTFGFWTDVTFENESGEEIRITPIGVIQGSDYIGPINRFKRDIFFVHVQNKRFRMDAGESLKLTHDMDDQNMQFILVEFPGDDIRIVKMDEEFWESESYRSCCWAPQEDTYTIPPSLQLPSCPGILRPAIDGHDVEVTYELINVLMAI